MAVELILFEGSSLLTSPATPLDRNARVRRLLELLLANREVPRGTPGG